MAGYPHPIVPGCSLGRTGARWVGVDESEGRGHVAKARRWLATVSAGIMVVALAGCTSNTADPATTTQTAISLSVTPSVADTSTPVSVSESSAEPIQSPTSTPQGSTTRTL